MISAIILSLGFILFEEKTIAKGLLLGTLFSIVNFILMGQALPKTLGITRSKAQVFGFFSIMGRYAVLAIPLILGLKMSMFNFWAVVVGIFAIQLTAMIEHTVLQRFEK